MPKRTDIKSILIIGAGPIVIGQACEFDYSGTQACKALKAEGYRIVLVNSNPATIMTDPELADATYIEPITPEIVAKIIETRAARRAAADHGRADRAQHGAGARQAGRAREVRRRDDRRQGRGHRQGRGPQAVPRGDGRSDRPRPSARQDRVLAPAETRERERCAQMAASRAERSGCRRIISAPSFTLGGTGGGIAYNRRGVPEIVERGLDASPTHRGAGRGERARLEGVRDGGGPRQGGQLHHRLLDRERRPDGRAHGRLDHRGAGADADRQGIPDHAQRLDRGAARDRRGDRRLQRAVRRQPRRRPPRRHRDEPARVALLGAGLQGDRLPDRQGRRQARRRLHAGRARERHHGRRHARLLRADHRLRRHQDPALRLREVSRRRAHADHLDEVGGRGDGDRPHVRGEPAEGAARPGDRAHRARRHRRFEGLGAGDDKNVDPRRARHADARTGCSRSRRPCGSASTTSRSTPPASIDPWFLARIQEIIDTEARVDAHGLPAVGRAAARRSRRWASRTRAWPSWRARPRAEVRSAPHALGVRPVFKRIDTCAAEFASPTAYMYSTYERGLVMSETGERRASACEAQPSDAREGHHPRRRPQPHRPGHRVRLLLLPRLLRADRRPASRPSWSTATRRRSRPTTTPPTGSTSSR